MVTSSLRFYGFVPCEDGYEARMATTGETEVPLNVFAEKGTDFFLRWGSLCEFPVMGTASSRHIQVFSREEDYLRSDIRIACPGISPLGLAYPDGERREPAEEVPVVEFSGVVKHVEVLDPTSHSYPFLAEIETLGMTVNLFFDSDRVVRPGDLLHCGAWLYGDIAGG